MIDERVYPAFQSRGVLTRGFFVATSRTLTTVPNDSAAAEQGAESILVHQLMKIQRHGAGRPWRFAFTGNE